MQLYNVTFDNSRNDSHNINITHPDYFIMAKNKRQAISKARKISGYKSLPIYEAKKLILTN